MFLASIRPVGGMMFYTNPRGATALTPGVSMPNKTTEFLVTLLKRSDGEHFGKGDQVELRSANNYNLVGCLVNRIVAYTRPLGSVRSTADLLRDAFVAQGHTLTTDFPVPMAMGSLQQQLNVEEAVFFDVTQGSLVQQKVRFSIDIPVVAWERLPSAPPLQAPFPTYPVFPESRLSDVRLPSETPTGTGINLHITVPNPGVIGGNRVTPTGTTFPRQDTVRCYVAHGPGSRIELIAAPHGDARDWFEVTLHPLRIRLRTESGRYLALAADSSGMTTQVSTTQTAWRSDLTLNKLYAPGSRILAHADFFWIRATHGSLLKAAGTTGAFPNGPLVFPPIGREADALYFTVARTAGDGPVADGDRVTVIAGRDLNNPQKLTVTPAGEVQVTGGAATTFILEFTKEARWSTDTSGNHASTSLVLPDGVTDHGAVGRMFIGCPMHGSPLAEWTLTGPGEKRVTGLQQGVPYPRAENPAAALPSFVGIEGFILSESFPGTVPVKIYGRGSDRHTFLTFRADQEIAAINAGYMFNGIEGHGFPLAAATATSPSGRVVLTGAQMQGLQSQVFTPGVLGGHTPNFSGISVMTTPRRVRALVLSGGGAKGCFEAGAVQALYNHWQPDIICGVSVGSVNAVKLAEGPAAAGQLVTMWRDFGSTPNAIFLREYYLEILKLLANRLEGKLGDTATAAAITGIFSMGMPFLMGGAATALGALIGKDLSGVDPAVVRIVNFILNLVHGLHSMEPLRRQLRRSVNPAAIASSGIQLRMGMTDLGTGQFFTVSGPDSSLGTGLQDCGRIECEPDHSLGGSWLTNPIYGADGYVMPLTDAVYCSSTLPVFMDPLVFNLATAPRVSAGGQTVVRLNGALPPGLAVLLGITDPAANGRPGYSPETWPKVTDVRGEIWEHWVDSVLAGFPTTSPAGHRADGRAGRDGDRGANSCMRGIFDGGLRDTLPIRTALRLGATEIVSISGDRLGQSTNVAATTRSANPQYAGGLFSLFGGTVFNDVDLMGIPALHNFMGMLNLFIAEVARSDSLLAWSQAEFGNWMSRASDRLPDAQRADFRRAFDSYWAGRGDAAVQAMGATSWNGGNKQTVLTPWGARCSITHIVPPRDYIDALDFDDSASIDDGIRLGAEAAKTAWRYVKTD